MQIENDCTISVKYLLYFPTENEVTTSQNSLEVHMNNGVRDPSENNKNS